MRGRRREVLQGRTVGPWARCDLLERARQRIVRRLQAIRPGRRREDERAGPDARRLRGRHPEALRRHADRILPERARSAAVCCLQETRRRDEGPPRQGRQGGGLSDEIAPQAGADQMFVQDCAVRCCPAPVTVRVDAEGTVSVAVEA